MKNLNTFIALFLTVFITISCSKNEQEDIVKAIEKEKISAKWEINNNDTYQSVEFNEDGKYILVRNTPTTEETQLKNSTPSILFGDYEILNSTTINLIDFGKITITDLKSDSMDFIIVNDENPEIEVSVTSAKIEKIENSTNTELLCKTWIMKTVNGESVIGTEHELTVIFSQAGTYFVELANPTPDNEGGLAEWKWSDETEKTLCYSWDSIPDCVDGRQVSVTVSSDKLTIVEGEDTYELTPYNSVSTEQAKKQKSALQFTFSKGIFKK
ncbi:hypothetical protein [Tenacibaculum sp. Ill]|uniref:hypothetical protein n=1 Tax=Tenacibaculum sp. Ill TaxID=3445935 RepID=UPI003F79006B